MPHTIYFFGEHNGDHRCFSNFFPARFHLDGVDYRNSEQAMMHAKAMLMGDKENAERILKEHTPLGCKRLGRKITPWDEDKWKHHREEIMERVLMAKFEQNPVLADILFGTEDAILAEASPYDCIWGIGLREYDACLGKPWRGMNLLGKCLQNVRQKLRETFEKSCEK